MAQTMAEAETRAEYQRQSTMEDVAYLAHLTQHHIDNGHPAVRLAFQMAEDHTGIHRMYITMSASSHNGLPFLPLLRVASNLGDVERVVGENQYVSYTFSLLQCPSMLCGKDPNGRKIASSQKFRLEITYLVVFDKTFVA